MKIKFVVVGKTVEKYLIDACGVYEKRIKKYVPFETVAVKDLKNDAVFANSTLILLDERGEEFTSKKFAEFLQKKTATSSKDIIFAAGGPFGFDAKTYERADGKISLSKMTFPHQMVRLIFLEQLYRAFTIIRGEPYHHE